MKQWMEITLLGLIAGLLGAFLLVDGDATVVRANDADGRFMAVAKSQTSGENFFLVDTKNQWVGLYTIGRNSSIRLVSAQDYSLALAVASLRADSERERVEQHQGWNVRDVYQNYERILKEQQTP